VGFPCLSPFFDHESHDGWSRSTETLMIHDVVLAVVFLGMIIAPALLAMRSEKEEEDTL
jgi:hypothetical protein